MTRSVKATKKIIEVGKKHVLDQRLRIERHKELTAELERDGQPDVVAKARRLLAEMEQTLARMQAEYAAAQDRLAQATVDEPTVAKVERDSVTCVLGTGYANALTSRELLLSCEAVDQTAKAGDGNSVDISSAGLPCWYYMSGVQNMSSLVDEANERLLNICSPSDSTVLDFARVFVHYVHGTNIRAENPAALVFKALIKAYPCAEHP